MSYWNINWTHFVGSLDWLTPVTEEKCRELVGAKFIYDCASTEWRQNIRFGLSVGRVITIFSASVAIAVLLAKIWENRKAYAAAKASLEEDRQDLKVAREKNRLIDVKLCKNVIRSAEESEKLPEIKRMIAAGQDLDSRVHKCGRTHLHRAVGKGQDGIVNELLKARAAVDLPDENGQTALHIACKKGQIAIAKKLIAAGASRVARDHQGRTPLMLLMEGGYGGTIDFLIIGDLNKPSSAGLTPLHLAASQGMESWIEPLLKAGADPMVRDPMGRTCIERLLEDQLPIDSFNRRYFVDCSKEERKEGANDVLEAFSRLNLRTQWSVKQFMRNIAKRLSPGTAHDAVDSATKKDPYFTIKPKDGGEIYLLGVALLNIWKKLGYENALTGENFSITSKARKIAPSAKLLLDKMDDWTPALQMLVKRQYRDKGERKTLIKELIASPKVDLNRVSVVDALRNARGNFEVVHMLLDSGKIQSVDSDAHVAAEVGAYTVLEELQKKGVNLTDCDSALLEAIKGRHENCIRLLVKNMDLGKLKNLRLNGLTLDAYALVYAPRGLREALTEKGFDFRKCSPDSVKRALKDIFLKDLKFFIEKTVVNIAELNTLIRELEGTEPHPSLLFKKLELGIDYFLKIVEIEEEARAQGKAVAEIPMPFGDYFNLRRAMGEIGNFNIVPHILGQLLEQLPKGFKNFFEVEQSLQGLASAGKLAVHPSKIPPSMSRKFKEKVRMSYNQLN